MKAKKDKAKDVAVTKKEKKTNSQDKNAIIKAKDAVIKALDQNGNGTVDIEDIIVLAIKTPGVHITRANFLKKELFKNHYPQLKHSKIRTFIMMEFRFTSIFIAWCRAIIWSNRNY